MASGSTLNVVRGNRGDYHWTLAEYYKLGDAGLFHDRRTELVKGALVIMPLPSEEHNQVVIKAADFCRRHFGDEYQVREEKGFVVPPDTDVGPDVAVVPRAATHPTDKPRLAELVIEVAFSTLDYDLGEKADLYASARVPLYLVIDSPGRRIVSHTEPIPDAESPTGFRFAMIVEWDQDDTIPLSGFFSLDTPGEPFIKVADLLV